MKVNSIYLRIIFIVTGGLLILPKRGRYGFQRRRKLFVRTSREGHSRRREQQMPNPRDYGVLGWLNPEVTD